MDLISRLNLHAMHHVVQSIFDDVDDVTVLGAGNVAASWRRALDDAGVWRRLFRRNVSRNVVWQTLMRRMENRAPQLFRRLVDVGDAACYRHVFGYLCDASRKLERNWRRGAYREHVLDLNDADDFVTVCRMDAEWIVVGLASGSVEIWNRWTLRMRKRIQLASGCIRDIRWHRHLMAVQFTTCKNLLVIDLIDLDSENIDKYITWIHPESLPEAPEVPEAPEGSKWGWELSRFAVGCRRLVAAVFISGRGQRIYERNVATEFVCYRLSACGAHVVKEYQTVLSHQETIRVEAIYCDGDVIIICMSTPSGGIVQLRAATNARHVIRQQVLSPSGGDAWRCMKNIHYCDGWILSGCFRICNIRPGVPEPVDRRNAEMRMKGQKQMTALERHQMAKTLVSDRVQMVTSVTLRRCRRPTRNKLIICDFLG